MGTRGKDAQTRKGKATCGTEPARSPMGGPLGRHGDQAQEHQARQ